MCDCPKTMKYHAVNCPDKPGQPMGTHTEFDKELQTILFNFAMKSVEAGTYMSDTGAKEAIKQAVDKYVIGENVQPLDVMTPELLATEHEYKYVLGKARTMTNERLAEQRQSLWGDK